MITDGGRPLRPHARRPTSQTGPPDERMTHPGSPPPSTASVELPNDRARIGEVAAELLSAVEHHSYPRAASFAVRLAFEEAVTNAFRHGHRGLPADAPVHVEYSVEPDQIRIAVEDAGPGFDPDRIPDPTLDENLDKPDGRGLMLIRAYMSEVRYNDRGNRVEMVYRRP